VFLSPNQAPTSNPPARTHNIIPLTFARERKVTSADGPRLVSYDAARALGGKPASVALRGGLVGIGLVDDDEDFASTRPELYQRLFAFDPGGQRDGVFR
jgi:hypothetical protein